MMNISDINKHFDRFSLYERLDHNAELKPIFLFFFSLKGQKVIWSFTYRLFVGGYKKFVKKDISYITDFIFRQKDYDSWVKSAKLDTSKILALKAKQEQLVFRPKISIVIPVYNPPEDLFRECLDSVLNQIYSNWELCIADDVSPNQNIKEIIKSYAQKDSRIKYVLREENGHISAASNSAIEIATGEYIALLDHDDLLSLDALYENVLVLNQDPTIEFIYSDEDKVNEKGEFSEAHFKPDFAPDNLLNRNYICHFTLLSSKLVKKIQGFRIGYEGSQDYDIFLRAIEFTNKVYHIPKVLYHWRVHSGSTAGGMDAKPYCVAAGVKSLNDVIHRSQNSGEARGIDNMPGHYKIDYSSIDTKKVSVIIIHHSQKSIDELIDKLLNFVEYTNLEIIILSQENIELQLNATNLKIYNDEGDYANNVNFAVDKATGDFLLVLDECSLIKSKDFINNMISQFELPYRGVVGAKILSEDERILHAGIVMGLKGIANYPFFGFRDGDHSYMNFLKLINNFSAVSQSCFMVRKEVFHKVNGFETFNHNHLSGIDFCLKVREIGFHNVYTPFSTIYNSCKRNFVVSFDDMLFTKKWSSYIAQDPCYNKNLSHKHLDFRLGKD